MEIVKAVSDFSVVLGIVAIVMAPRAVSAYLANRRNKERPS
jgi:hypothetical protein